MKTETVPVDSLIFDPANARKHGEKNLAAIKGSLQRFGQQKPIVVDAKGIVRAGNGTLAALIALGWKDAVIVRSSLSGSEATAYAIADNRTAELAEWDDDTLKQTLAALQIEDEDLAEASGFDEKEIDALLAPDVVEDEVPEPPANPITKTGDLWLLGEHRVLCGDSTKFKDVKGLMGNEYASLLVTDPPYNINYTGKTKKALKVENDNMSDECFRGFLVASFSLCVSVLKPGSSFYIFHADSEGYIFRGAVNDCGQSVRQCLIWVKDSMVLGRQDYQWKHEPCLYGWTCGGAHRWFGGRSKTTCIDDRRHENLSEMERQDLIAYCTDLRACVDDAETSVIYEDRPKRSDAHPTMKPVALIARLVVNSSLCGESIYDPFLGSGTTLIAAEQLKRKCYGMEISPAYCDVIVKRWENLTGRKAVLERREDGAT